MARLIFQLGTNNWQRDGEFAPGSGILHESHHRALNELEDTHAYSMYPSRTQRFVEPDVQVFELDHDIPICESVSPVSSYRWHSMSETEVDQYRNRLRSQAESWIDAIEAEHGEPISLAVAHHTFLNPIVMADINQRRLAAGRPRIPVLCFVHGTALKMYAAEAAGDNPTEFPARFLPMLQAEGIFAESGERRVDWCAAISTQQVEAFQHRFDSFPVDRIVLSPNGYNQAVFSPTVPPDQVAEWRGAALASFETDPYKGSPRAVETVAGDCDHYVVFCGKFAAWKRLDAFLRAAAIWEQTSDRRIGTIIVGSGPHTDQVHYQELAYDELALSNTWFVGPRDQPELAQLFTAADVGCFPSKNEPFGLVFIEAMACATPVIGANSGGPRDFVTDQVGVLVDETDDIHELARRIAAAVERALAEDWKLTRGPIAMAYAEQNFSVRTQVENLLARLTI